ncbi:MAG TPA: hypothetical protein VE219_05915, partial [Candidatus Sulfotelmatobacter sp.]|nr:hypothetical protein [Candidatus Sulfotelmatobacter sp.]
MLFNSVEYGCFLVAIVLLYHLSPKAGRLWVLLAGSYFFYASYNFPFLLLIIALTAVNYMFGLALSSVGGVAGSRKLVLAAGVTLDIAVLCFFKYLLFLI